MEALPTSNDQAFENAEVITAINKPIKLCELHTKDNWREFTDYRFENGCAVCNQCGWGTPLAGYFRVLNGKIVDLRGAIGQ